MKNYHDKFAFGDIGSPRRISIKCISRDRTILGYQLSLSRPVLLSEFKIYFFVPGTKPTYLSEKYKHKQRNHMSVILAIAPHPDDEMLGCGGTLLRHLAEGDTVYWLIVTAAQEQQGYDCNFIQRRTTQIIDVKEAAGFNALLQLNFPTTQLDTLPLGDIISALGHAINQLKPDTLYVPYGGDVHSDHGVVFAATKACSKWFRYPSVRRIYSYETPSETNFSLPPDGPGMPIQRYVDISKYIEKKIEILSIYKDELGSFPFPRSIEAIRALAQLRGAASGFVAAEGFQVLKEIV